MPDGVCHDAIGILSVAAHLLLSSPGKLPSRRSKGCWHHSLRNPATESTATVSGRLCVTLSASQTTGTATITITNDTIDEPDETVILTMGDPTNATKGTTTVHTATITDDDLPPPPTVTSIAPTSGINLGAIGITDLLGTGFQTGATVKMTRSGKSDSAGTGVSVVGSTKIACTFDLTGKATGQWNVVVTNPDAQSGTLTNGFTISSRSGSTYNIADYFPLCEGSKWYRQGTKYGGSYADTETAVQQVTINGNPAMKITNTYCGCPNYTWSDPSTGFWHFGFDEDGSEIRYDTPIRIPANLTVGHRYSGSSNVRENGKLTGTMTWSMTLESVGGVTNPARVFNDCLVWEVDINIPGDKESFRWWMARDVGEVKEKSLLSSDEDSLVWANVCGRSFGAAPGAPTVTSITPNTGAND